MKTYETLSINERINAKQRARDKGFAGTWTSKGTETLVRYFYARRSKTFMKDTFSSLVIDRKNGWDYWAYTWYGQFQLKGR